MKKLLFTAIVLFAMKAGAQSITCASFCVLDINNLDTIAGTIDVTILNNDSVHVNYPTVVVTDGAGDTIANINSDFYFFAHLAGDTLVHSIPTDMSTFPSGFTGTVYYTDQITDQTCSFAFPTTCTVGINEIVTMSHFQLYPNPASDFVTLKFEQSGLFTVRLFDTSGKEIINKSTAEDSFVIDCTDLPEGLYFATVSGNGGITTRKIIIAR